MVREFEDFLKFFVCLFFLVGSYYITQDDLKIEILLPQPPEFWDYRSAPQCLTEMIYCCNLELAWCYLSIIPVFTQEKEMGKSIRLRQPEPPRDPVSIDQLLQHPEFNSCCYQFCHIFACKPGNSSLYYTCVCRTFHQCTFHQRRLTLLSYGILSHVCSIIWAYSWFYDPLLFGFQSFLFPHRTLTPDPQLLHQVGTVFSSPQALKARALFSWELLAANGP